MRWFERHLNLTMVLTWIVAWLILPLILDVIWDWGIISDEAIVIGLVVCAPAITLFVTGWVLRKKNRSLFNLLWYLVSGIGAIVLLCLKNESEVMEVNKNVG